MFKLYKNMKIADWLGVAVILALTFLQVWCTMSIVDYIKNIIQSVMYVNWYNNPGLINGQVAAAVDSMGWDGVLAFFASGPMAGSEMALVLEKVAAASVSDIWHNAGIMIAFAGLMVLAQIGISVLAGFVSADLSTAIRKKVYSKIETFSLAEINRFSTPSLITRTTNDIQNVQITNVMMMRMIFAAPVTAVWAIVKINASSMQLTVATATAVVILLIFLTIMMTVVLPKFKIVQRLIDKVNGVARENLTGIRIIRAFNAEEYQQNKFEKANENLTKTQIFTGRVMSLMSPVMMLIMNGITLTIYWLGSRLINEGVIDYPTVTAFSTLSSQIIMAFMMLMLMFVLWPRAQVCANRINEVLETENSVQDPVNAQEPREAGTVEFRNVSFKYPNGENNCLQDISFKVQKGQSVAIIGATGSGKTSLVNLMMRFYDATEGEVLVDGVNVKNMKMETLRSLIGYVPQHGFLFKGTVADNVALGLEKEDRTVVEDACRISGAYDFVMEKSSLGFDFEISQGGKNVSGGQRQRLCIARAVAKHPEIYIFDDSFSALDYKTDRQVRNNLANMNDNATRFIVAQRIGTIMDADMILVLDKGRIVGAGKHRELLENCTVYRDIALSQLSEEELGICQ